MSSESLVSTSGKIYHSKIDKGLIIDSFFGARTYQIRYNNEAIMYGSVMKVIDLDRGRV